MAHITGPEIAVDGLLVVRNSVVGHCSAQGVEELVEIGTAAERNVVNVIASVFSLRDCCENVGLNCVIDVAEVATGFAIAVDEHILSLDHRRCPFRHHGGIGTVRVLAAAEDVEVT